MFSLYLVLKVGLTVSAWRSIAPGYVGIVFDKATHTVTPGAQEPGWAFINPRKVIVYARSDRRALAET